MSREVAIVNEIGTKQPLSETIQREPSLDKTTSSLATSGLLSDSSSSVDANGHERGLLSTRLKLAPATFGGSM
ncbi:hypothetical protein TIFTF001_030773 [Ficus carica]|uniref:Uncharacterized protein n=1 Tax=Ficus carica TaxID=3494 RepID=A0AA88DU50_FICCA|nr:hypothetical protein TIFTF001_030773 [Ficus carica]